MLRHITTNLSSHASSAHFLVFIPLPSSNPLSRLARFQRKLLICAGASGQPSPTRGAVLIRLLSWLWTLTRQDVESGRCQVDEVDCRLTEGLFAYW